MKILAKQNKGITLIALVITIIVLLILAGVAITILTGENGMLKNANLAAEENLKGQIKEEIELAMQEIQMEELTNGRAFNMEAIVEKISDKLKQEITIGQIGNEASGEYREYNYTITEDYQVILGEKIHGTRPVMTHTLDTEVFGASQVIITVTATVNEGTIVEMTKPDESIVENTNQVTYTVTRNGSYLFKAKSSKGKTTNYTVTITNMRPSQPRINAEGVHPSLTNEGVKNVDGRVVITYDESDAWINTYSQDNGVTWQNYTGPFTPTSGIIKARSTAKDYSDIYVEAQQEVMTKDYIGAAAYDGDNTTAFSCVPHLGTNLNRTSFYLGIDPSVQGKTVYVKFTARQYSEWAFTFFDKEGNEVGTWPSVVAPWNEGYQDGNLVIPARATELQVQYRGGNKASGDFYEIAIVQ